jgi:hypothetical protein
VNIIPYIPKAFTPITLMNLTLGIVGDEWYIQK